YPSLLPQTGDESFGGATAFEETVSRARGYKREGRIATNSRASPRPGAGSGGGGGGGGGRRRAAPAPGAGARPRVRRGLSAAARVGTTGPPSAASPSGPARAPSKPGNISPRFPVTPLPRRR